MVHWARDARVVLWLPFLCLGYLFVRRRAPAAALVVAQPLGALAFYGVSHPLMFPWYMCTFAPLASLFALLGVAAAGEWVRGPRVLRAVATLAAIVCLSWRPFVETWWPLIPPTDPRFNALLPNAGPHARVYQYAAIARWLNARVQPAERVCLSEIGALGYYYHGRVLDGLGLVSPEALRYHPTALRPSLLSGDVREQIQPADAPRAGALPPALVHDLRPEYVVSMDIFAESLFADPWFQQHYALIGRWPWYAGPVAWHDLPARVWGSVEMRAYHRLDAP